MNPHTTILPPEQGFPGDINSRVGDGLHFVQITIRWPAKDGTAKTLHMLARVVLEVVVAAKEYRR